ncbi:MAG: deoxycytidylate deaminase [Methylobacteriaceae bacterium]|nr:deoxycytidylate deaminase [Methylobacteriaceae bacterium]
MDWFDYALDIAATVAKKSKDETKVGAVLLDKMYAVRGTAFNGPPIGVSDTPDRFERPRKYLFASHAEQNIIAFAARHGVATDGCLVAVTHYPCSSCARSLIQAGISEVWVGNGTTSMPEEEFRTAAEMFREANVVVKQKQ